MMSLDYLRFDSKWHPDRIMGNVFFFPCFSMRSQNQKGGRLRLFFTAVSQKSLKSLLEHQTWMSDPHYKLLFYLTSNIQVKIFQKKPQNQLRKLSKAILWHQLQVPSKKPQFSYFPKKNFSLPFLFVLQ